MKIGVVGAGYVGLTTGICLASLKHKISIFDVDEEKLEQIRKKNLPFFEKGLEEILEKVISTDYLIPQNDVNKLVSETDGCFICVGTPTKNNSIDLTQIINSVKAITESIKDNQKKNYKIIIRSTMHPGRSQGVTSGPSHRKIIILFN